MFKINQFCGFINFLLSINFLKISQVFDLLIRVLKVISNKNMLSPTLKHSHSFIEVSLLKNYFVSMTAFNYIKKITILF